MTYDCCKNKSAMHPIAKAHCNRIRMAPCSVLRRSILSVFVPRSIPCAGDESVLRVRDMEVVRLGFSGDESRWLRRTGNEEQEVVMVPCL